jgi:predicted transcriptional regulator
MTSLTPHPPTIAGMSPFDRRARRQRESADPVARYLGELQAEVMATLWEMNHATVRAVLEHLNHRRKRKLAYTTVLTLVSRLWTRGLLTREPDGRGFRYRPAKSRDALLAELSDELIDRLFTDFGEIAIAQLGTRLEALDAQRRDTLRKTRKR